MPGVISLMLHFSWPWVGLAVTEDPEGLHFLSDVRAEEAAVLGESAPAYRICTHASCDLEQVTEGAQVPGCKLQ